MSITLTRIPGATVAPANGTDRCSWCDKIATVNVTDHPAGRTWVEITCNDHLLKYWPSASIVTPTREPRCEVCGGRGCTGHDTGKDWACSTHGDGCNLTEWEHDLLGH